MPIDLQFVAEGFDSFQECQSHWSKVLMVQAGGGDAKEALDFLLREFYRPTYHVVRAICPKWLDARDLTHDFAVHIVEHDLVLKADRAKGSFRSYFKSALLNYLFNRIREERLRRGLPIEEEKLESNSETTQELLDREFALEVFAESKKATEEFASQHEMTRWAWKFFVAHDLDRAKGQEKTYEELAKKYRMQLPLVENGVRSMRDVFRAEVWKRLEGCVADRDEMRLEIAWWIEQVGKALRQS